VLVGSPQKIIDDLKTIEAAGIGEVILYFNYGLKPHAMVKDQMQRFMEQIAPAFGMARSSVKAAPTLALDDYLPYLVNRVGVRLVASFAPAAAEHGLSVPMWRVLAVLAQHGRSARSISPSAPASTPRPCRG